MKSTKQPLPTWQAFVFELLLYAGLVVAYFFFVLHYLSGWFKDLYDHDRTLFAVMALLIMIGQAVGLQIACDFLVWLMRGKKK
jgi:Kef-type K+ transport system membrane component KefB